ncbi:MAG: SsrA-binding protein SmpB [Chthoniobacterales bacterium]|jgi:SsrA-binding protein|nr:SsrA-binding protein SmpB [Chthoniobacterales bacterium]
MGTDIVTNRKARHSYHILESFEAGIALRGTEVKSIRLGLANMSNAFARLEKGELFLHGLDIQPYVRASHEQHEPKRPRRLLVHRHELLKLREAVELQGCALPAIKLYWKNRNVKVQIGVAKGKKAPDKRQDLKQRVAEREAARTAAAFNRRG